MKKIILVICSIIMCVALFSCDSKEEKYGKYINSAESDFVVYETNDVDRYLDFLATTPEDKIIDITIMEEDGERVYHVTFKR